MRPRPSFTGMHTDLKGPSFLPTDTEHSLSARHLLHRP